MFGKMSEIMDDYDAGFEAGFENGHECGTEHGFENGKGYAQEKVLKLMDEVIAEYEELIATYPDEEIQAQVNAVKFMKSWVLSGGHEDENGNRVCLVW
tara:strand:+ start:159 stop:452 length:294 start_codon:yes stop_codon:yes gene_type:complete